MSRALWIQGLLAAALLGATGLIASYSLRQEVLRVGLSLPPYRAKVGEVLRTRVRTRDGIELETRVHLPAGEGPWPVVLLRNPYDLLDAFALLCEAFARYGYACVHQDVRGRMGSGGEWSPLLHERGDGLDTFDWLRQQRFQDGRWALFGMSYLAGVHWTVADALPEEVKTLVSMVFGVDTYRVMYEGGVFRPDVFSAWASLMPGEDLELLNGWAYRRLLLHRPAREADEAHLGRALPWYRRWLDAPWPSDPIWTEPPFTEFYASPTRISVPVLMLGGYFDPFFDAQVRDFERLYTRADSRLVLGPWDHLQQDAADVPLPGSLGHGAQAKLVLAWIDHHLRGGPAPGPTGVVDSYDIGAHGWRRRIEFPPAPDHRLRLHLTGLPASSRCPGGQLTSRAAFRPESPARFRYDPDAPIPSRGGASALAFAFVTFPSVKPGALAQPDRCDRDDLLRFTSEPLDAPLSVVGRPEARLRVSSSAEDTAFGFALRVQLPRSDRWILVRESYQVLSFPSGVPGPRGEVVPLDIDAWPIEWTLPAGARLSVEVRSSSFPAYSAHPNRRGAWAAVRSATTAEQRLHPGSYLELPIRDPEAVLSAEDLARVGPNMACTFDIQLPLGAPEVVARARKMVEDAGGSLTGDDNQGSYKLKLPVGSVEGSYTVAGTALRFEITKKPMLVPCSAIEGFLRDRLK